MTKLTDLIIIVGVVLVAGAALERIRLRRYWQRTCTGLAWRRRFPSSPKAEIRSFLDLFVNAFAFRETRRLCFSPDDKPVEVYRALYPLPWLVGDSMELETFIEQVRETFEVDLLPSWREDITLGELYELATRTSTDHSSEARSLSFDDSHR